jgi:hypothetical protein
LPASTLVDFFKRLIVFLAILVSSYSIGPSGALPAYMQVIRHLAVYEWNALSPSKSVNSLFLIELTARPHS